MPEPGPVLITGAKGHLGGELTLLMQAGPYKQPFLSADKAALYITDYKHALDYCIANQPSVIINCAAYTAVDKAESVPESVFEANEKGPANLAPASDNPNHHFVHGDICNRDLVAYLFSSFDIRGVFHLAAESHVDNSIAGPEVFVRTNVHGTFNFLDNAYQYWMKEPFTPRQGYEDCRFLHVSTDEVYGSLGDAGFFTETTPYNPSSPYSASKASSDILVRSYYRTYGQNIVITNCSNNYDPRQHTEKLIPTIIRTALDGSHIPIYGHGKNVRDWLYVEDHCRGIDLVFHSGAPGTTYNVGGENEWQNIEIAHLICRILNKKLPCPGGKSYTEQITFVKDRPGHDLRYAIDASKIETELGWHAMESFESGMEKTVSCYLAKYKNYEK